MNENRKREKFNRRAGNGLTSVAGLVVALTVLVTGFGGETFGIAYGAENPVQSEDSDAVQTVTKAFSNCKCYEDANNKGIANLTRFTNTSACKWLAANAHKFGFIIRYTEKNENVTGFMAESWHIRYLGKKHATIIYEKGIKSYEEYKVTHIDHQK